MPVFALDIEVKGVFGIKRSEVNSIFKEAFYLTGLRWRRLYLPRHFGRSATQRYKYDVRSFRYKQRKKLVVGHERPLEFSGEGKRLALKNEQVIATRKMARMPLPRKFNLRPKGGDIQMGEEVKTVRPDEARDLTRFFLDHVRSTLRALGQKRARVTGRLSLDS